MVLHQSDSSALGPTCARRSSGFCRTPCSTRQTSAHLRKSGLSPLCEAPSSPPALPVCPLGTSKVQLGPGFTKTARAASRGVWRGWEGREPRGVFGMRVTVVLTSLVLPGLPAWLSLGRLAGGYQEERSFPLPGEQGPGPGSCLGPRRARGPQGAQGSLLLRAARPTLPPRLRRSFPAFPNRRPVSMVKRGFFSCGIHTCRPGAARPLPT